MVKTDTKLLQFLINDQDKIIAQAEKRKSQYIKMLAVAESGGTLTGTVKPRGEQRNGSILSNIVDVVSKDSCTKHEIISVLANRLGRKTADELKTLSNTVAWNLSANSKPSGALISKVGEDGHRRYRARKIR